LSLFSDTLWNSNLTNFFRFSPRQREIAQTKSLLRLAQQGFAQSRWSNKEALENLLISILVRACDDIDATPSRALARALYEFVDSLAEAEGIFAPPPSVDPSLITIEQGVELRSTLSQQLRFYGDAERLSLIWERKVWAVVSTLIEMLPSSVLIDASPDGAIPDEAPRLEVALADLLESPSDIIEGMMAAFFADDCMEADLFRSLRRDFNRNMLVASNIDPNGPEPSLKSIVPPHKSKLNSTQALVDIYCFNTPLKPLLSAPLPFAIPFPSRFEHSHVIGGSGHGKTQLLQYLIAHDLAKAKDDKRSIVVMDSQGDLIRTIAGLSYFDPSEPGSLADRLLIVDPTDVEFPACLNMFDWNRGRIEALKPLDRERLLNGTVELYEYLFGALLGAELTQRQGVIFKYIARLMMEIPGATIQTLRELMENGEKFRPYMEKLPGSARAFFETRFFDRTFNETKKQILTRLWGVLSNGTFERMFSHERNKVDLYEAMSEGKIVLINTAKELLTHDGAAIFGRFFIALIAQASLQRSALQPHERNPAFVYIDEAQDYFDDKIGHLLNQARKYRVGMVLAHQNLDQLSLGLRSTVMSSTSIKLAGGVSAKDARALAEDMRCDADFLQKMRKTRERTEFACFVRNFTPKAVQVSVPLGFVESLPRLPQESVARLIEANRNSYGAPVADVNRLLEGPARKQTAPKAPTHNEKPSTTDQEIVEPIAPPPEQEVVTAERKDASAETLSLKKRVTPAAHPIDAPKTITSGKGGRQHKYLQHLTKGLAEGLGFKAVVEERILDGAGQVDVALYHGELKIACEISITTGSDQELRNIEKCFAAGFARVILIADEPRHLASLRKSIAAELDDAVAGQVAFCVATDLSAILQAGAPQVVEQTVRGYRVRVKSGTATGDDAHIRRKAIAGVIARSLANCRTS
jgi:hypothetical protein